MTERNGKGQFVKGHSGSKPKGSKQKIYARSREDIWSYIDAKCDDGYNANPFRVLIDTMIATDEDKVRIQCASIISDKLLPNLRAVDATHEVGDEARKRLAALLGIG